MKRLIVITKLSGHDKHLSLSNGRDHGTPSVNGICRLANGLWVDKQMCRITVSTVTYLQAKVTKSHSTLKANLVIRAR